VASRGATPPATPKLAADKRNRNMTFRVIEVRQTWTVAAISQPAPAVEDKPAASATDPGTKPDACPVHKVKLNFGATAPKCPDEHGIVEYGVFGDEGSLENYDCAYEAANMAAYYAAEDPDTEYTVRRVCNEHPDEPADTCGECNV
jgi:hypothetical protein